MKKVLLKLFLWLHEINLRIRATYDKSYLLLLQKRGAKIGKNVFAQHLTVEENFAKLLTIEDDVVFAYGVRIILHDSALNNLNGAPIKFGKVAVRKSAYIGARSTILAGVEIGEGAIIGACSLVTKDIPAHTVAYGIPALVKGTVEEYQQRYLEQRQQNGNDKFAYLEIVPWRDRTDLQASGKVSEVYKNFLDQITS
jgi:acetyltransferase-like isoleucine patch superfamily enzyme